MKKSKFIPGCEEYVDLVENSFGWNHSPIITNALELKGWILDRFIQKSSAFTIFEDICYSSLEDIMNGKSTRYKQVLERRERISRGRELQDFLFFLYAYIDADCKIDNLKLQDTNKYYLNRFMCFDRHSNSALFTPQVLLYDMQYPQVNPNSRCFDTKLERKEYLDSLRKKYDIYI